MIGTTPALLAAVVNSNADQLFGPTGDGRTPLDDIASVLHQGYITSEWHEQSQWAGADEEEGGQFLPHQLLTSLLRAVVVAWNDPVDTLTRRMAMAESLGAACGLGESEMEQVSGWE